MPREAPVYHDAVERFDFDLSADVRHARSPFSFVRVTRLPTRFGSSTESSSATPLLLVADALASKSGGAAMAAIRLVEALAVRDDVGRVLVVAERDSMVERALSATCGVETLAVELRGRGRLARRAAWEAAHLPALVESEGADAVLSLSGMVPRRPRCPVISLLANPVVYERPWHVGNVIRRRAIARTIKRCHQVYVPSAAMADLVGSPKTKVVPYGVDGTFFHPAAEPGDGLLAVGDFYPWKRYELLIAAWNTLPEPRPRLRLVGNPAVDRGYFEAIRRLASDPRIAVDGFVEFDELLRAYRQARVFVLASEHESFALPLAEALTSGVPAVVRDHPALRETGGPGALYVAGDHPAAWADAIWRLERNESLHAQLRAAGLRHARAYTWARVAETVVGDLRT
jgi:glycosyltransferase involved in cell wall biosynthesis